MAFIKDIKNKAKPCMECVVIPDGSAGVIIHYHKIRIKKVEKLEKEGKIKYGNVGNPKGVKTPDYLINGERYDLKTIKTAGKNTFYNRLKDSKGQAESFILDLSENKLLDEEIIRQIEYVFISNHTRFVKMIVIMKNQKVVKAFKRKK